MKSVKELNRQRMAALEEVRPQLEKLINNYELFCPYDRIIIEQGNISVVSTNCSISTKIFD